MWFILMLVIPCWPSSSQAPRGCIHQLSWGCLHRQPWFVALHHNAMHSRWRVQHMQGELNRESTLAGTQLLRDALNLPPGVSHKLQTW